MLVLISRSVRLVAAKVFPGLGQLGYPEGRIDLYGSIGGELRICLADGGASRGKVEIVGPHVVGFDKVDAKGDGERIALKQRVIGARRGAVSAVDVGGLGLGDITGRQELLGDKQAIPIVV